MCIRDMSLERRISLMFFPLESGKNITFWASKSGRNARVLNCSAVPPQVCRTQRQCAPEIAFPLLRNLSDLCKLPVHFFPSKMSIISTPQGLETIKDLCIIKETKKIFEIRLQKLHFGEFQEIQLFSVQNRWNLDTSSPGKPEGNVYRQGHS